MYNKINFNINIYIVHLAVTSSTCIYIKGNHIITTCACIFFSSQYLYAFSDNTKYTFKLYSHIPHYILHVL